MKGLKSNITYKVYLDGMQFLQENEKYLNNSLETTIETAFFFFNAKSYTFFNQKNYAFSFKSENEFLLLLKVEPYNALLFGSANLCEYAANVVSSMNLVVENMLGEQEATEAFLKAYQERKDGEIQLIHSMKIMVLRKLNPVDTTGVYPCTSEHVLELAKCYQEFELEAMHQEKPVEEYCERLRGKEGNVYAYFEDGKIVSIASLVRNFNTICAISHVYTKPAYRGKGYSARIVTKLCQKILEQKKTPYFICRYIKSNFESLIFKIRI